jgi:hypothetical protein
VEGKIADDDYQAAYQWVLGKVTDAGRFGIPEQELLRLVRGKWPKRQHEELLGQMVAAGEVWRDVRSGSKGGRPHQRIGRRRDDEREAG